MWKPQHPGGSGKRRRSQHTTRGFKEKQGPHSPKEVPHRKKPGGAPTGGDLREDMGGRKKKYTPPGGEALAGAKREFHQGRNHPQGKRRQTGGKRQDQQRGGGILWRTK